MKDFDNDFSVDSILNAAKNKDKSSGSIKPIGSGPAHKAPHALTPDEVLHVSGNAEIPDVALPDFDEISNNQEFIVFETDIDPDLEKGADTPEISAETAETDSGIAKASDGKSTDEETAPENTVSDNSGEKNTKKDSADFKPTGNSAYDLYREMKANHAISNGVLQSSGKAPAASETGISKNKDEKHNLSEIERRASPAENIDMERVTARPVRSAVKPASGFNRSSLSIEDIINAAEKNAESKVKNIYAGSSVGFKSAASFKKFEDTPHSTQIKEKQVQDEVAFAPVKRKTEPSEPPKQTVERKYNDIPSSSESGIKEKKGEKEVASFSSGVFSRQTLKVTPVKRSRVFVTPSDDGVSTPATKVIAKEIPVKIDVVDDAVKESFEDNRIKEHNPYASQYSLADAQIPGKGKIASVSDISKSDIVSELFEGEKDIVSSADTAVTGSTVQFNAISSQNDDFDLEIEKSLPPVREEWEDDFEKSRKTKTSKFRLFGNSEPEIDDSSDIADEKEAEEILLNDYEKAEDAPAVAADLKFRLGRIFARLLPTALITLVMFLLATPLGGGLQNMDPLIFSVLNLGLLAVCAVINYPVMKGAASLIAGNPDGDAPAAISVIAAFLQTAATAFIGEGVLLAGLGGLALTFNLVGKFTMLSFVSSNFKIVGNDDNKKSVFLIDGEKASHIAGNSVLGDALIASGRRVKNASGFLSHSFRNDPYESVLPKVLAVTVCAAVLAAVSAGILIGISAALTVFAAVICLGCPITSLLLANLPLILAARRLNRLDSEITGYYAAREIGYSNAMALDASDLFPDGSVSLFNMHILAPNPIDRSILEAAAIANDIGSPIAGIFNSMIDDGTPLPKVDTIKVEEKMGVSGWIGEKRIFIGNRTLMTAHNIPLPSLDVDKRILRSGYFPVYLATSDGPCALFIVGYSADEEISYQLRRLTAEGVTLLINSCDQNVNEDMICDYFDLYPDSVKVMNPQEVNVYNQLSEPQESSESFAVCKGNAAGLAAILTASIRVDRLYRTSLILHLIMPFAGIAITCTAAFSGGIAFITALFVGLYQIISGLITCAVAFIYRP